MFVYTYKDPKNGRAMLGSDHDFRNALEVAQKMDKGVMKAPPPTMSALLDSMKRYSLPLETSLLVSN